MSIKMHMPIIKTLLIGIHLLISTNISKAMSELEQDIEIFRNFFITTLAARHLADHCYHEGAVNGVDLPKLKNDELYACKLFFESLILRENYNLAFNFPKIYHPKRDICELGCAAWCYMPQNHIDEVKNNTKSYIRTQSPLILEKLLATSQYTKAYNFSVAYRDVFSTVDVENATLIQTDACNWLTQIQTKATTEIEEIANTFAALTGREILQETYRLKGIMLIDSFPEGDCIRIHLQARFDTIASALLTAIPNEEMVRLKVVRKMADQLFPSEG